MAQTISQYDVHFTHSFVIISQHAFTMRSICDPLTFIVGVSLDVIFQRDITPYRAHAHERSNLLNRVPEHDLMTFRATQNEM